MSYAVRRPADPSGSDASGPEAPATTATVLDFICLFTHDLRRKQKRWQDGRLKYHTFNKRVMVYDDRGNFIGDAHWQAGGDLAEGEELELDRGAAIVQVADCTGSREQDLTEILDKRAREVEKRRLMAAARTPTSARTAPTAAVRRQDGQTPTTHLQLNHRKLSSIMPHSPGPIGRAAIPNRSPFEVRQAESGEERGAKRRRVDTSPPSKAGFARSLFGATLTLSQSAVGGTVAATASALRERTNVQQRRGEGPEGEKRDREDEEVVVLDEPPRSRGTTASTLRERANVQARRGEDPGVKLGDKEDEEVVVLDDAPPRSRGTAAKSTHITKTPHVGTNSTVAAREAPSKPAKPSTNASKTMANVQRQSPREEPPRGEPVDGPPRMESRIHEQRNVFGKNKNIAKPPMGDRRPNASKGRTYDEDTGAKKTDIIVSREQVEKSNSSRMVAPTHQNSVVQIQSSGGQLASAEKTELRTELRIRSRQRRGLLMVSEKRQQQQQQPGQSERRSETPGSSEASVQIGAHPGRIDTERQTSRRPQREMMETTEATPQLPEPEPEPASHVKLVAEPASESEALLHRTRKRNTLPVFDDSSSESDALPANRRRRKPAFEEQSSDQEPDTKSSHSPPARKNRSRRSSTHRTSDEGSDTPPLPPKKRPTREKRRGDASSVQKTENAPLPSGPRITKMARKSIKSREIIGFIPPAGDALVPAPFATATNRIGFQACHAHIAAPAAANVSGTISHAANHVDTAMERGCGATAAMARPPEPNCNAADQAAVKQTFVEAKVSAAAVPTAVPTTASGTAKGDVDTGTANTPSLASAPSLGLDTGSAVVGPSAAAVASPSHTVTCPTVTTTAPDSLFRAGATNSAPGTTPDALGAPPKPTISNPATRGKKAATQQHAAGQAPQSLVPMEPAAPVRVARSAAAEPKKQTSNFPGFSAANGGAWSRHAEDLLGMGRPTRGKP